MKFLTTLLMLVSLNTFASDLSLQESVDASAYELAGGEPISGNQVKDIKKALYSELLTGGFNCTGEWINIQSTEWNTSSVQSYFNGHIPSKAHATLSIDKADAKAPVITATVEESSYTFVFKFVTNPDMTKAKSIVLEYDNIQLAEKNFGSLISPRFEKARVSTSSYRGTCTSKQ